MVQDLGVAFFDVAIEGRYSLRQNSDKDTRWRLLDVDTGTVFDLDEDPVFEGPRRIAYVNLGPLDMDIDSHCGNYCAFPERSLEVWAEFAPEEGEEDPEEGESLTAGACACSSASSGSSALFLLLPVLAFLRRRP
jgi:hypothetical protein